VARSPNGESVLERIVRIDGSDAAAAGQERRAQVAAHPARELLALDAFSSDSPALSSTVLARTAQTLPEPAAGTG
jgi:hypothetical protein